MALTNFFRKLRDNKGTYNKPDSEKVSEPFLCNFTKREIEWIKSMSKKNCNSANGVIRMCINKQIENEQKPIA
jgi:hypothetical protein